MLVRVLFFAIKLLLDDSLAAGSALNQGAENGRDDNVITAVRTENGIVIDGELDELDWDLANPISDLYQQEPQEGEAASERTEIYLLYDDENLCLGARCFDSAGKEGILVTDMRRDYPPFDNDTFVFVLDTFTIAMDICSAPILEVLNTTRKLPMMAASRIAIGTASGS